MFYILVIENGVSLIDLTILTFLGDLGNSVTNVFWIWHAEHFTVAPVVENTSSRQDFILNLNIKVIAHYFGVLCLYSTYFHRTNSYFCTTSLLNLHKPSKLKVGRVRNSGKHVAMAGGCLKTVVIKNNSCIYDFDKRNWASVMLNRIH